MGFRFLLGGGASLMGCPGRLLQTELPVSLTPVLFCIQKIKTTPKHVDFNTVIQATILCLYRPGTSNLQDVGETMQGPLLADAFMVKFFDRFPMENSFSCKMFECTRPPSISCLFTFLQTLNVLSFCRKAQFKICKYLFVINSI